MSDTEKDNNTTEIASLAVAVVALLIALVALAGTTAQVFQQYLATAVGYSNCGKRVIGPWAEHTKLKFHWWELRYEVLFMSPVVEVRPARLDMQRQEATVVGGLTERYITRNGHLGFSDLDIEKLVRRCVDSPEQSMAYAASWLTLLREIQQLSRNSRSGSSGQGFIGIGEPGVIVCIKGASKTLDLMPEGIKRPYATSTLGSVVLLTASLGLHWKQFDRANDRYLADGNGLLMTGFSVPHLGIMFSFTRYGSPRQIDCPVIEGDDAANLCFGLVSTIFKPPARLRPPSKYLADIPRNLDTLRLGSRSEMAATFRLMGFESDESFMNSVQSAEHVFPVAFEIVGMLARSFYPPKPLRSPGEGEEHEVLLPNPLPYHWDTSTFSPGDLLLAYARAVNPRYRSEWQSLGFEDAAFSCRYLVENPNHILALCDNWLYANLNRQEVLAVARTHVKHVIQVFNDGETSKGFQSFYSTIARRPDARLHRTLEDELVQIYVNTVLNRVLTDDDLESMGYTEGMDHKRKREIWLVLMMRMFIWLTVHTFHPADIQLPKSDVMGSEQPVYIG
ncbi:hypothetical protein QBC44DRAFT_118001 [Cladorrhinum sp. PSN332]|nr:hypothetical protein QBC44DRAFT_118001 [Cladorrhinum sp. PSN332]